MRPREQGADLLPENPGISQEGEVGEGGSGRLVKTELSRWDRFWVARGNWPAEEGRRARMGGDVTLNSHKGEPGLFFAETDDISLLNGGCFHFIFFLASNEISRALRVFQKLAGGL